MKTKLFFLGLIITILSGCQRNPKLITRYINPNLIVDTIKINVKNDTLITTNHGTLIAIPKESFQFQDGKDVIDDINLIIQEVHSSLDLLKGQITTISNDQIIESGGMINILAVKDSQYLLLKKSKQIRISIPKQDSTKDWKLFKGELNSKNNSYNWTLQSIIISTAQVDTVVRRIVTSNTIIPNQFQVLCRLIDPINKDTSIIKSYIFGGGKQFEVVSSGNNSIKELIALCDTISKNGASNLYYSFLLSDLGWVNIDRFLKETEVVDMSLTAQIEGNEKYERTEVNLIFLKRKIFLSAFKDENEKFYFSEERKPLVKLPLREKVLIFLECYKNEQCFYDIKKIELGIGNEITFKPKKIDSKELKKLIEKEL